MPRPSPEREEAGYTGHFMSQEKHLVYNMSEARVDGTVSLSLETCNGSVSWAQSWDDKGHKIKAF